MLPDRCRSQSPHILEILPISQPQLPDRLCRLCFFEPSFCLQEAAIYSLCGCATLGAGNEGERFSQFGFVQCSPALKGRRGLEEAPQAVDMTTPRSTNISRYVQPLGKRFQLGAEARAFVTAENLREQIVQHDALL
jgi:hypothetical protein